MGIYTPCVTMCSFTYIGRYGRNSKCRCGSSNGLRVSRPRHDLVTTSVGRNALSSLSQNPRFRPAHNPWRRIPEVS